MPREISFSIDQRDLDQVRADVMVCFLTTKGLPNESKVAAGLRAYIKGLDHRALRNGEFKFLPSFDGMDGRSVLAFGVSRLEYLDYSDLHLFTAASIYIAAKILKPCKTIAIYAPWLLIDNQPLETDKALVSTFKGLLLAFNHLDVLENLNSVSIIEEKMGQVRRLRDIFEKYVANNKSVRRQMDGWTYNIEAPDKSLGVSHIKSQIIRHYFEDLHSKLSSYVAENHTAGSREKTADSKGGKVPSEDKPKGYDVFLSFKMHDNNGAITQDHSIAKELHQYLSRADLRVFFSDETLRNLGQTDYGATIDNALESAPILIAIGTSRENLMSGWVQHEWRGFLNDINSGHKPHGKIFNYISQMKIPDLPMGLRHFQTFQHSNQSMEQLLNFIKNALKLAYQSKILKLFEKASIAEGRYDWNVAISFYREILDIDPNNNDVRILLERTERNIATHGRRTPPTESASDTKDHRSVTYDSSIHQKLVKASGSGNIYEVKDLLLKGADVRSADAMGYTALMRAAENKHLEIMKVLLDHGANINYGGPSKYGPLLCGSSFGFPDVTQFCLERGADVNVRGRGGTTPLIRASRGGHLEVIEMLIKWGAEVDAANKQGKTPLIVASRGGFVDAVTLLIDSGADLNKVDKHQISPLMHATNKGMQEVVKLLIRRGADLELRNARGETALDLAKNKHKLGIVAIFAAEKPS